MGIKYRIGSALNLARHLVLRHAPLRREFPVGVSWLYDCQRFAGTKSLTNIFDVGANIGQTASGLVRYFPKAEIFCFEPASGPFKTLVERYGGRPRVHLINQALADEQTHKLIRLNRNSEKNTLVEGDLPAWAQFEGTETIHCTTLDNFCSAHSVMRIDILKMDVQGYEMKVLDGASDMLACKAIRFVFSEVGFTREDIDMQNFSDLHARMLSLGFRFSGFYDFFRWGDQKQFLGFANALYMNPAFAG